MKEVQRYDVVWREEEYKKVKDIEGEYVLYTDYQKLERKAKRLETRLLKKQYYETELLVNTGATPRHIVDIHKKDEAAMAE